MSEAPCKPLCCHGERRYISYKVEAKNPALWKTGTREGLGSQWCDRVPSIPRVTRGGRSCGRRAYSASYMMRPPLCLRSDTQKEEGWKMRRIMLLVAATALTVLVASGVA